MLRSNSTGHPNYFCLDVSIPVLHLPLFLKACGATAAQVELNKKRDTEVVKLRRDLEESHIQRDATVASMKKKQNDSVAEMNEQIEQLSKMKTKVEKDKNQIVNEISDVRAATDEVARSKVKIT